VSVHGGAVDAAFVKQFTVVVATECSCVALLLSQANAD
jgi:hypothetical protein